MSRNPETTARLMAEAIEEEALGHYLMHSTFNPHKQYLSPHDFVPSEYKQGVRDRLREIKAYDEQIAEQGRAKLSHAIKKAAKRDYSLSVVSSRVRKASARCLCHIALDTEVRTALQALATGLTAPSVLNAEARKHEPHTPHIDNSAFTLLATIDAVDKECPGLHFLDRWVASNMLEMMTHVSFRAEFHEAVIDMLDGPTPILEFVAPRSVGPTPTRAKASRKAAKKDRQRRREERREHENAKANSSSHLLTADHLIQHEPNEESPAVPKSAPLAEPHRRVEGPRLPLGPRLVNAGVSKSYKH
ncbi:hypothetical protein GGG16DRAFT_113063 [Schizophyllum commune]